MVGRKAAARVYVTTFWRFVFCGGGINEIGFDSTEQFEWMRTASLTVDRDMTICPCAYRMEGEQE